MASLASPYSRCADQPMVSSSGEVESRPQPPRSRAASRETTGSVAESRLRSMKAKNYNVDWDAGFGAPMSGTVPPELGGMRFDQALARLFPQYSRNRLQAWLKSGHIRVEGGVSLESKDLVAGGERVVLVPPPPPEDVPEAHR